MQNYIGTAIVMISFALGCSGTPATGSTATVEQPQTSTDSQLPPVSTPVHMPTPDPTAPPQLKPTPGATLNEHANAYIDPQTVTAQAYLEQGAPSDQVP